MVVLDRGNCARFWKRFLITFFGLFSENKENSYYCHENSFGDYANRHFRTHDLKLILQTRHRTSHTRPVGGLQIFVLHKIFFHQNAPTISPFSRGVFDWRGMVSGDGNYTCNVASFYIFPWLIIFKFAINPLVWKTTRNLKKR